MEYEKVFESISEKKKPKATPITKLNGTDALEFLMGTDRYCTYELPEYFDFSGVLYYAKESIGAKSLDECVNDETSLADFDEVNLDIITNKDGRYGVRPLTLANPFLYYMLARDICNEDTWQRIQECFNLYRNKHFSACSIPMVKVEDKPEAFREATSILNWWNSMEQTSIELSLKYRYMFITDITNCFGQINPESIGWALAMKDTVCETEDNNQLALNIQHYLRTMQHSCNIGIPQGSTLFSFLAEIILGYSDMLFAKDILEAQINGELPKDLDYQVLRYVDDYRIFCNERDALDKLSYMLQGVLERFNFRMNTSKTKISTTLIADSIKPDKAFYIFNTPIESKQTYKDEKGCERKERGFDFDGFQKHLLFIYEFSRRFPNAGQLKNQLSAFSQRIEELLSKIKWTVEYLNIDDQGALTITKGPVTNEYMHLWENISTMVAISVQIAADNVGVAHYALKVASQMLTDMPESEIEKKNEVIELIYQKLRHQPNSAFLQVWIQNITHTTDDWSQSDRYDMPLCKLVANRSVKLWNNSWLKAEIADNIPIESIINRETLEKTGQVITFKEKRLYDEMSY
ncbi:MAG: RNA-directed DNA polymerase [Muribaculaceae bacterium]